MIDYKCKKIKANPTKEKPGNNGWLGYFEADSDEAKALIEKEVEASHAPNSNIIARGNLINILPSDASGRSGRYGLKEPNISKGYYSFIRPIKEKPLKPVNENCLFKGIVYGDVISGENLIGVLAGFSTWSKTAWILTDKNDEGYGYATLKEIPSDKVKRGQDIKYGDEDG